MTPYEIVGWELLLVFNMFVLFVFVFALLNDLVATIAKHSRTVIDAYWTARLAFLHNLELTGKDLGSVEVPPASGRKN